MKKAGFFLLALLVPCFAFAADAVVPADAQTLLPPEVIVNIISIVKTLPVVGAAVVFALKWIAVMAPIMTALSVAIRLTLAIPELIARYQGAPALADKIKALNDKIVYWVDQLSILNAKKPQ